MILLPTSPPKNYKISSAFSYNFILALTVLRWHGVLIAGVRDEAVFLYSPQVDFVDNVLAGERAQSFFFQPLKGNFVGGGVYFPVHLVAPGQGLSVQVRQAVVLDPHHEIIS